MGIPRRAVRALVLLIGFYCMGFGLLAALAAIDAGLIASGYSGTGVGRFMVLSVLIAIPLVRGIFFTRGNRMRNPPGVPVTPQQQPLLWQSVSRLADRMGTRPPRELRIVPEVNAFVHENPHLAGLLPGRRRMFVGVPLLIGLTPGQLEAVLCHELGHYSNKDTRLAGLVQRGRQSMLNTVRMFAGRRTGNAALFRLYRSYAEHYLRTTEALSRQQEIAADREAARIAGRDNAALALRQLPALDAGYDFYLDRYAAAGRSIGLLPTADEFLGGFRHLLADPERAAELEKLRREPPETETSPFDTHPPITARIAAIEAMPDDGRGRDTGSALSLVADPAALFATVARDVLAKSEGTAGLAEADWPTLVHRLGRARAEAAAKPLRAAVEALPVGIGPQPQYPPLALVLDLVDAGWLDELAARLPEPEFAKGTTGPVRVQHLRTDLEPRLLALVRLALADSGRGGWPVSWSRVGAFEAPGIPAEALREAVAAMVAMTPSTAPLRALLAQG
ncbi:M48 family metallopeptidase [Phaeacidiphilus oryzae]|uniref:M48 family metallopeptidase n=1 Tax=Phaeacidiphilus oryzae TaxID=348818 RepID=UPI00056C3ABF|nr:M48 family metallopeptidase [Phaeacidiphilus oryzae]